jgi:hypothetical protein
MPLSRDFSSFFPRLQKSKFRSRFKLDKKDIAYIEKVGIEKIRLHANDFVKKRLAPANPQNDGKQTPFKNHPVFKAQHATAICCRGCIAKWYGIPRGRALSVIECEQLVNILMSWINRQMECDRTAIYR